MSIDGPAEAQGDSKPNLRVGTEWIEVEILTDPFVVLTRRGYAPAIEVEHLKEGRVYTPFAGAASLAERLEPIRTARGSLEGAQVRLKKEGDEKFAQFLVDDVGGPRAKGGDGDE